VPLALALLVGVGICGYLTWHHENELYGNKDADLGNCPQTEFVNCEVVNSSAWSELGGIPIASFGIPTYLLLLVLLAMSRRQPRVLGYVFGIGLLTVLYSGFLYYISTQKIGFLCLWCMRLYAINLSIPLLSGLAMWRNPMRAVGDALGDLTRWPAELRTAAMVFVGLFVLTVGGQKVYRAGLQQSGTGTTASVADSSAPAASVAPAASGSAGSSAKTTPGAAGQPGSAVSPLLRPPSEPGAIVAGDPVVMTQPLRQLVAAGGKIEGKPYDLQARLGKGRPQALIFWAPGYGRSESVLQQFTRFIKEQAPGIDVVAIAGVKEEGRIEYVWEVFQMLGLPSDVTLLVDDGFELSKAYKMTDVPNLMLVDAKGNLLVHKIKALGHVATFSPSRLTGEDIIRQVGQGAAVSAPRVQPYYPATELYGECAPTFTAPNFANGKPFTFTGKGKRPTLLVFWSSTCKHCQQEIPLMVDHYKANSSRYDIVSITTIKPDKDGFSHRTITEKYIDMAGIEFPVIEDAGNAIGDMYNINSTPTTFLIGANGQIVNAWYSVHQDYPEAIERALTQMAGAQGTCKPSTPPPLPVMNFSMTSPENKEVALSSLTDKPTLVHLWATWCAPCRKELPSLLRFKETFEKRGGRVVLVSVEDASAAAAVAGFGAKNGLSMKSFFAPRGGLADQLELSYTVPRTYVLGPGGRLLRTFFGEQNWDDAEMRTQVMGRLQMLK